MRSIEATLTTPTPPEEPGRKRGVAGLPFATWPPSAAVFGAFGAIFIGVLLGIPAVIADPNVGTDDASVAANVGAQVATVLGFLLAPFYVAGLRSRREAPVKVSFRERLDRLGIRPIGLGAVKWMFAAYVAYFIFAVLFSALITEPKQDDIADLFGPVYVQILLVVFAAGIGEEICFRGMLFGGLRNGMGPIPAAILSGLIFGGLHALSGVTAVPQLAVLGIIFALLYERTGSIVPGMILHIVNNSLALLVLSS